jgi:hypothetical protein
MPTIQPLSLVERDYLAAFGVTAVCTSRTGKVFTSENPCDASQVFWCKSTDARRVADLAQRNGDIVGAASRLQVQLTEHVKLIARVRERTGRIEAALQHTLKMFNQEYRRRLLAAQAPRVCRSWTTKPRRRNCAGSSPRWSAGVDWLRNR